MNSQTKLLTAGQRKALVHTYNTQSKVPSSEHYYILSSRDPYRKLVGSVATQPWRQSG